MSRRDRRNHGFVNLLESMLPKPKDVNTFSIASDYYYNQLMLILKGRFHLECPEYWDSDYVLDTLLNCGVFCVTDTAAGILPLMCSPTGINWANRHTDVEIANPVLGAMRRTIGENCELVYLYDNLIFRSVVPLVQMYAAKLANCDSAIDVNMINCKVANIFECADAAQAETAKRIYDEITMGKPAVFVRKNDLTKDNGLNFYTNKVKENFIANDVIIAKHNIVNDFLTTIGIRNSNRDKKERQITDEINGNNEEIDANVDYWKKNLKTCVKKIRNMFPNLKFDLYLEEYVNDTSGYAGTVQNNDK